MKRQRMSLVAVLAALMILERSWKYWMVARFFRRPVPAPTEDVALASIMQPILSGDPTLEASLHANVAAASRYRREWVWLVDDDDAEAQRVCQRIIAQFPHERIRMVLTPPPAQEHNPKMVKLIRGAALAEGDVVCVLDDDTRLPPHGLDRCLPFLDEPGVGLAFGLPYYVNFSSAWSSLLSVFVNSHSILTYVPYTTLTEPFTINGMFYAMRRRTLEQVGGFAGLETWLADDFAVAHRLRAHGLRLRQTPTLHGISTTVRDARHYTSLMRRWFVFPRESIMRYVGARDQVVLHALGTVPALLPLALLGAVARRPSWRATGYAILTLGHHLLVFIAIDRRYLGRATPRRWWWTVPVVEAVFPVQLLAALAAPQRITWRGHRITVERGGTFRVTQRRS
jgi:ceramide glucosyltransferase